MISAGRCGYASALLLVPTEMVFALIECSKHEEIPFNSDPIIINPYFARDAVRYIKLYAEYIMKCLEISLVPDVCGTRPSSAPSITTALNSRPFISYGVVMINSLLCSCLSLLSR